MVHRYSPNSRKGAARQLAHRLEQLQSLEQARRRKARQVFVTSDPATASSFGSKNNVAGALGAQFWCRRQE
ncbi:hypothetical protein, partial [Mesorhizobium sp.]|uniref:hypothetical protein n=1 Tax=Mesorhizobium sp. TaxID=1871066 RepID=UPI00344DADDF